MIFKVNETKLAGKAGLGGIESVQAKQILQNRSNKTKIFPQKFTIAVSVEIFLITGEFSILFRSYVSSYYMLRRSTLTPVPGPLFKG